MDHDEEGSGMSW